MVKIVPADIKLCMTMDSEIKFRKPDRYKLSSYRSYNTKMPGYYDSAYFIRLFKVKLWYEAIVDSLLPESANMKILDVGCGTGTLLAELGKTGASCLYGIDLAEGILKDAEKKLNVLNIKADLQIADAEDHIPWKDNEFDLVTMTGTLHHFYRPLDVLSEVSRVLKPGGRIILIDQTFITPMRQIINLYLKVFPHDGDYHFYSVSQTQKLLNEAGFNVKVKKQIGVMAYYIDSLSIKNK